MASLDNCGIGKGWRLQNNIKVILIGCVLLFMLQQSQPTMATTPIVVTGTLEQKWCLGGESDNHVVGLIIDAVGDDEGNIYLLDYRFQVVFVISPEGDLVRTIGGLGDGPGETRSASRLFSKNDGKIGIVDMRTSKISWLSTLGIPLSTTSLRLNSDGSGVLALYDARIYDGGYVAAFMRQNPNKNGARIQIALAQILDEGPEAKIIFTAPDKMISRRGPIDSEVDSYNFVHNCWDVSANGEVFIAPDRDSNSIEVFSNNGKSHAGFNVACERSERTRFEKQKVIEAFGAGDRKFKVADFDPFFSHVWCDENGQVWTCSPGREKQENSTTYLQYDVFTSLGDHQYRIDIESPRGNTFSPSTASLFIIDSSRVVIIEKEGAGNTWNSDCQLQGESEFVIGCYELKFERP